MLKYILLTLILIFLVACQANESEINASDPYVPEAKQKVMEVENTPEQVIQEFEDAINERSLKKVTFLLEVTSELEQKVEEEKKNDPAVTINDAKNVGLSTLDGILKNMVSIEDQLTKDGKYHDQFKYSLEIINKTEISDNIVFLDVESEEAIYTLPVVMNDFKWKIAFLRGVNIVVNTYDAKIAKLGEEGGIELVR